MLKIGDKVRVKDTGKANQRCIGLTGLLFGIERIVIILYIKFYLKILVVYLP